MGKGWASGSEREREKNDKAVHKLKRQRRESSSFSRPFSLFCSLFLESIQIRAAHENTIL